MITNDREYRITRAALERLEEALAAHREDRPPGPRATELELVRHGVERQAQELRDQLIAYTTLRNGGCAIVFDSLDQLGDVLIQGRIAAGLTQRALAGKLGLKEQQVQRYEQTRYAHASLSRVREVAGALQLTFREPASVVTGSREAETDDAELAEGAPAHPRAPPPAVQRTSSRRGDSRRRPDGTLG